MSYQFDHDLASGARLTILVWDHEHRWIFSHAYREREADAPHGDVTVFCNTKLVVEYSDGCATDGVTLSHEVVLPQRLGKQFFAGVDISPGAKTYIEFGYQRVDDDDAYRIAFFQIGARPRVHIDALEPGITKPGILPIPEYVRWVAGGFRAPFLYAKDDVRDFVFPRSVVRAK